MTSNVKRAMMVFPKNTNTNTSVFARKQRQIDRLDLHIAILLSTYRRVGHRTGRGETILPSPNRDTTILKSRYGADRLSGPYRIDSDTIRVVVQLWDEIIEIFFVGGRVYFGSSRASLELCRFAPNFLGMRAHTPQVFRPCIYDLMRA